MGSDRRDHLRDQLPDIFADMLVPELRPRARLSRDQDAVFVVDAAEELERYLAECPDVGTRVVRRASFDLGRKRAV